MHILKVRSPTVARHYGNPLKYLLVASTTVDSGTGWGVTEMFYNNIHTCTQCHYNLPTWTIAGQ